jgi:DNA-directed RNA polymerase sigma subunit (sigma70/sigma32)
MITLIDSMEILLSEKGARKFFNDIIKINENKRLSNKFLTLEDIRNIESSSPISYYIKKYEPIDDPEEEIELVKKYQKKKDPKAFDRLIRAQSKYILKLIMNNKRKLEKIDPNISTEEVFNVMIINFAKAINKFDTEKGARFYTYLRQ